MTIRTGLVLAAVTLFLGGCAVTPQVPIQLASTTLGTQAGRVGVAMTALPKVDTDLPGASCLLCLAVVTIANSALTKHTRTLPYEDLPKLKEDMAELLRKKGTDVTVIAENLDLKTLTDLTGESPTTAEKDFSPLQKKYNIDKLLVIDITHLGFLRTYSAYLPSSDPKARLKGASYIVNLKDNSYEWYVPLDILKSADGNWDEPPSFPGLTNAYFQTLELGKDSILTPVSN